MPESSPLKPDLILTKAGRPIAVVEAKTRPVSRDFEPAVYRQLQVFSTDVGTPWAILVDPKDTRIFLRNQPFIVLSTEEVLSTAFTSRPKVVGERTLLVALDHWFHELPRRPDLLRQHPKLEEFAHAIAGAESTLESA